ncbi:MAG: peptidylprolyl isomerase [Bacteroidota bacterium]
MHAISKFGLAVGTVLILGCNPSSDLPSPPHPVNKFADSTYVQIYEAQDHRDSEVLLPFLTANNPGYRAAAAEAFGSVQDTTYVPELTALLQDPDMGVARAAAWALGQTGHPGAGPLLLQRLGELPPDALARDLGEAIGKCGAPAHLDSLLKLANDNAHLEPAAMQGLYRYGLRQMAGPLTAYFSDRVLLHPETEARLCAAAFIGRNRKLKTAPDPRILLKAYRNDTHPDFRQHLVRAFNREDDSLQAVLTQLLPDETADYRVRVNAIRALGSNPPPGSHRAMEAAVRSRNHHVAYAAATFLLAHVPTTENNRYREISEEVVTSPARQIVLALAMRLGVQQRGPESKYVKSLTEQCRSGMDTSANVHVSAHYLLALAENPTMEPLLVKRMLVKLPVISTYAMQALTQMYQATPPEKAEARIEVIRQAVDLGDVGITALAAGLLRTEPELQKAAGEGKFLQLALQRMRLPEEIETYHEVEHTLAVLRGETPPELTSVPFNNAIDWNLVRQIPADQVCLLHLPDREEPIKIELLVEAAPGTVANFVRLVQQGFYRNAVFHRVVPNFVAQGGDPRKDGYGSAPQSIRSEWPALRYRTGYLGMASAGKDTESCQWFIVHSSTPHLDGRYTIFARVTEHLDYIHDIGLGDEIVDFTLPGLK